jgi:hypothetical protein
MIELPRLRPTRSGRRTGRDRTARERRVLYVGLAVSVVLHGVVIGLASRWLEPVERDPPRVVEPRVVELERALRAVAISETGVPEDAAPDVPEAPPPRPAERPAPVAVPAEEEARPRARRTPAERLAPRIVEPGLWRPMVVLPRDPTIRDVQDRVAQALEMLSDSLLAETERALRARDWTVEDAQGGRWGISPGKLHLGSVTVPLPIYFPVDMEQEAQNRMWLELDMQADRAEFLESFDQRVRAIRERRDRERSERRPANSGG